MAGYGNDRNHLPSAGSGLSGLHQYVHAGRQRKRDSICRKYEINVDSKNATFYGCSNGGGYGVTLFFQNNDSFKQYICFSPLGNIKVPKRKLDNNLKLYIAYGEQENFILTDKYQILIKGLNKNIYNFENTIYNGGHERKAWKNQFTLSVSELFRL